MLTVTITVNQIDAEGSQPLVSLVNELDPNAPFQGMLNGCMDAHRILQEDQHLETPGTPGT